MSEQIISSGSTCNKQQQCSTKFSARTNRVKNIVFHPCKPWVIVSMRSGIIQLWDYNLKISIAKFDQHDGGVRALDFHPQLPLFVSGGDDSLVKVWDYKQKRCLFTLKGHIDYLRTAYFHKELPWILTSSDDQTMRIWNYQSRCCINIITGHSHYVMCAQFHHQKNLIVSCSLDGTVRLWDFTILKKKLTETKNVSSFVGIQIQCIKVLEGHQRGVDWVCFHPTQNLIASGSDDRKIKLWKYTNQVAWQHSTLTGHKNNVSCVMFDKKTGNLISNSQDKTTRIWNIQSKTQKKTISKQSDRYWIINQSSNGNFIGLGHDNGFQIIQINKQHTPFCLVDDSIIIYANGMKAYMYDMVKKNKKQELYQFTPYKPTNNFYVDNFYSSNFDSNAYIVQVNDNGTKRYSIKRKQGYLNFPMLIRNYDALDTCFISKQQVAALISSNEIHLLSAISKSDNTKQVLKLNKKMNIKRIFNSNEENVLVFVTDDCIAQYDVKKSQIKGQQALQPNTQVINIVYGYEKIAILCKNSIIISNNQLQTITTIKQNFVIHSAFWKNQDLLFYTTQNHCKYALMNGQTGLLLTLQKPIHLVKKVSDTKFIVFNQQSQQNKVYEFEFPSCVQIQFKLAVMNKDWTKTKILVKKAVEQNKKYLVSYLVEKGLASIALDMVQNPQEKFSLAILATNFQLAFEICNQINTQQYWRLLGDQALKQGIYEAYELANQKLKNFDKLNFLYSLQGNTQKLQKIHKLATKMNNPMLAFNCSLFLGNHQQTEKILRECGLDQLAALSAQTRQDPSEYSDLLKRLGCSTLDICQPEGETDFSNWPHNGVEQDEEEQEVA